LHRDTKEPFSYSERAIERLRHQWIAREVAARASGGGRVLDLGCSRGQLTAILAQLPVDLTAIDVAPSAIGAARTRLRDQSVRFTVASALALPIASAGMDFVVAADGIYSWNLESDDRHRCLEEIHRILAASGRVLFTEHTRAFRFPEFVAEIEQHDFAIERVDYLYDRPWYQVESWFKVLQGTSWVRTARRSDAIARFLQRVGRVFGPRASRHVCVLASRRTARDRLTSFGADRKQRFVRQGVRSVALP
jgi:ubiquinone/menaquinone biosynthesis C-methylase UbiE